MNLSRATFVPVATDHAGDAGALIDLYIAAVGDRWFRKTKWTVNGTSFCTWYGITCNANCTAAPPCRVQGINLFMNMLFDYGQVLSSSIGELSELVSLNLGQNLLSSTVPSSIGNLQKLTFLNLVFNNFDGSFPESVGNCSRLVHLNLVLNGFTSLPTSLSKLVNLQYMDAALNYLTSLPVWPSFSLVIQTLRLLSPYFQTYRPASSMAWIRSCPLLKDFSISGLEGPFPDWLDSSLVNLQQLKMSWNRFTGPLPSSLCQARDLRRVNIRLSALSGPIPECLQNLTLLYGLELDDNQFDSTIPGALGNLSKLQFLRLSGNSLVGTLPPSLGSLPALYDFVVSRNQLSGGIDVISRMPVLSGVSIDLNQFEGTFPKHWASSRLNVLAFNNNYFTGSLEGILNATWARSISHFVASNNRFTGPLAIPDRASMSPSLTVLNLDNNFFSGSISESICDLSSLTEINLSHNLLTNTMPLCVSRLFLSVNYFNCSGNKISGLLPEISVNGSAPALATLDLSWNVFEGDISQSYARLVNLANLDLSFNRLGRNATFPRVLFELPKLDMLDLSSNLYGGGFDMLQSTRYFPKILNVSYNFISGSVQLPRQHAQNASDISSHVAAGIIDIRGCRVDCPIPQYDFRSLLFLRDACRPQYETFLIVLGCVAVAALLFVAVRYVRGRSAPADAGSRSNRVKTFLFVIQYVVSVVTLGLDVFTAHAIMVYLLSRVDNCSFVNNYSVWGGNYKVTEYFKQVADLPSFIQRLSVFTFSSFIYEFIQSINTSYGKFGGKNSGPFSNFERVRTDSTIYNDYMASINAFPDLCFSIDSGCAVRRSAAFPTDYATECYLAFDERAPFGGTAHRTFMYVFIGVVAVRLGVELLRAAVVFVSIWHRRIAARTWTIDFVGTSLFAPLFVVALRGSWSDFLDVIVSHETSPVEFAWRVVHQSLLSSLPLLGANVYFLFYVDQSGVQTVNLLSIAAALVTVPLNVVRAILARRQKDHSYSDQDVAELAARSANRISFSEPFAPPLSLLHIGSPSSSNIGSIEFHSTAQSAGNVELVAFSSTTAGAAIML